jgi:hypothetical protein
MVGKVGEQHLDIITVERPIIELNRIFGIRVSFGNKTHIKLSRL